ncbi:MAG: hypothetical protein ABIH87_00180 [bacterium]
MIIKTEYGIKKDGTSKFVIIAPHGAGDDLKTGAIARCLAKELNGFLIINKKFIKPSNSKARLNKENIEDFNRLRWGPISQKYFFKRKKKEMKLFYNDIARACDLAKKISTDKKAVAIYIHGSKKSDSSIDIGCGVKYWKNKYLLGSKKHNSKKNSGQVTLKVGLLKKLRKQIESKPFKDGRLLTTIGEVKAGWSKHNALQFHKSMGRNDYAFQLEMSNDLRSDKDSIHLIAKILLESIIQVF